MRSEPVQSLVPASAAHAASPPLSTRLRRWLVPWAYLAIPIFLLLVFTYVPIAAMLSFSLVEWDGLSRERDFVGLENYLEVFRRPELFGVFATSLFYLVGAFVQLGIALYLAVLLSYKVRFRNLFKGIIFFPYLINGVAIGFIFLYVFQPDGVLDTLLASVGLEDHQRYWLGERGLNNASLASVSVWRYMGLNFVLFLGAIQSIPHEILEAASIDGASRWQQFRYVIAPGIKPVIGLSFILAIQGSLAVFDIPYIMTGGSNGSSTFVIQTVDIAFKFHKVGLGSAMAVILLLIILVVTGMQRRIIRDDPVDISQ